MERKLVKQGRNALTTTLPAKWLKEKGLKAGDSINILERNKELILSSQLTTAKKEIELDLRGENSSFLFHVVQGKYIEGYDSITLLYDKPKLAQELLDNMLGMIIDQHTSTRTVFKNMIAVPEENFDALLNRALFILLQQAKTLEAMAQKKATVDDVKIEERLLDYNLLYCLRYLNKYENREHAYKYFLLCLTLESAGDQITELARFMKGEKELAAKVVKGVEQYVHAVLKKDFRKAYNSVRSFRASIGEKTFVEGIAYSLAENLYNNIGYLFELKD